MNLLRNRFLGTTAFLMDAEGKSAAEIAAEQRGSIKVEVSARSDSEKEATDNANKDKEKVPENKETDDEDDDGTDDEGDDEKDEDEEIDDENKEETDEQKTARLAKEKEDRKQVRLQKRFDKLTAERNTERDRRIALEAQLAEKPKEGLTEEEVERRATAKAQELTAQQQNELNQQTFDKNIKTLAEAANKVDKEFSDKINDLADEIGPIPGRMINMLVKLDNANGGAVLAHLANNVDEAEDIWALDNDQMLIKLIRLSDKLKPQPRRRQISGNPPPNKIIRENNNVKDDVLPADPTKDMDAFVRIRNQQAEAHRKNKFR